MICGRCKTDLPDDAFTPYRLKEKGWCRACSSAYNRDRYLADPESIKHRVMMYRRTHPEAAQATDQRKYRKHYAQYQKAFAEYGRKARAMWPEKYKAGRAVRYALQAGWLIKPSACSHCGRSDKRIEAHHPDYSKPLFVVWLCAQCHRRLHASILGLEPRYVQALLAS